MPKITTIIPTYRRPEFLKHAIQSVLDQTYRHLRLIVCDNLSNDGTKEVVLSFAKIDDRVQYFCQPEHVSMIDNFETALSLVKTPYYSLLCDDDFLFPHYYELAVNALENEPDAAMFCGGTVIVNEKREIFRRAQLHHDGVWDIRTCPNEQMQSVISEIVIQACVFRKGEHETVSRINPPAGWDETMTWNVVLNYPIITTSKFVVGYRRHSGQDSLQTVALDVPNEVKFLKLIKNGSKDVVEKLRFTDQKKGRAYFFMKMVLAQKYEVAQETLNAIGKYNSLLYFVFSLVLILAKSKLVNAVFNQLYVCCRKVKQLFFPKKTEINEFAEIINAYSDPI